MLLSFRDTAERLCDQVAFEIARVALWWDAGGLRESIDGFEDEEAWECAAEVGDAVKTLACSWIG